MFVCTQTPEFFNDLSESIRAFYPEAELEMTELPNSDDDGILHTMELCGGYAVSKAVLMRHGTAEGEQMVRMPLGEGALAVKRSRKRSAKLSVFYLLREHTGKQLPWGSLTGIRPTRLIYERDKMPQADIERELHEVFGVDVGKIELLRRIIEVQAPFIRPAEDEIDIYVGIPFCATRCVYCSFATLDATKHFLIPQYMDALLWEIRQTAQLLKNMGKRIRCLYIGGGTPTALPAAEFSQLMQVCAEQLAPSLEFTVEAGRPDTISREKLLAAKAAGVQRISINPQTMNDCTLQLIGRHHSAQEIVACFAMAREIGFETINADLIAGLPGENKEMFMQSLREVIALAPENITVHTLSVKKGSRLAEGADGFFMPPEEEVKAMVEGANAVLQRQEFLPYYLYRQKYQSGNLENVGYAKEGHVGVYNIDMMEETASICALGAGAISKRVFGAEHRIERAPNCKSIYDYIARIEEMIERKKKLFAD